MKEDDREVGRRLRIALAAKGVRQGKLAERTGLSQSGLSLLLNGKSGTPRPATLKALAAGLNVPEACFRADGPMGPLLVDDDASWTASMRVGEVDEHGEIKLLLEVNGVEGTMHLSRELWTTVAEAAGWTK